MKNIIKFYEKGSVEIVRGQSSHCFPLHSHESFCVGIVTNGTALFTINGTECLLSEHMIFIIPPNTGVSITPNPQYSYVTICFKDNFKKQVENINFDKYFLKIDNTEKILTLCNNFKEDNNEDQFFKSILKLINTAIEPSYILEKKQTDRTTLLICRYINQNAIEKFNLNKLSESFYLSKYHLIRIFKKEMGVTPHQYYIQAKIRIIKTNIFNIHSEINLAIKLNLFDQSHLCKLFKKQMGISIRNYRKNLIRK